MNTLPRDAQTPENACLAQIDILYLCDGNSPKCSKTACAFDAFSNFKFCRYTRDRANSINYKSKAPTKEDLRERFNYSEHEDGAGGRFASYWEKREEDEINKNNS